MYYNKAIRLSIVLKNIINRIGIEEWFKMIFNQTSSHRLIKEWIKIILQVRLVKEWLKRSLSWTTV